MKVAAIFVNYHAKEKIAKLQKKIEPAVAKVIVIDNDTTNRGFAKGVNEGIKIALKEKSSHVLLLNPDLEINPTDIKKLTASSGDIVSPVLKFRREGKWIYDFGGKVNWMLGRTYHNESTDPSTGSGQANDDIDYVSGACMLIKAEVFQKIGLFDERFFMYFEDVDFCLRAKQGNFTAQVQDNVIVEHDISEHRFSNNAKKAEYLLTSNREFIDKWIPWYFKPIACSYWVALTAKSSWSVNM